MPCNPNVGGSSKGHLVRELDALGGEMGKNIDKTFIQSKMLNESKGPAVHSLRAQADKQNYSREMRNTLENTDHLTIRQAEVTDIIVENGVLTGVKTFSGAVYHCKAAVLATGTYLKAMLSELSKSGSIADITLRELTGKGFADLKKEGTSTTEILSLLNAEAQKNDKTLKDMFGSVEAGSAALVLYKTAAKNTTKCCGEWRQAQGRHKRRLKK